MAHFTREGKAKKKVISAYLAHVQALNVAKEYGSWIGQQTMHDLMSQSDEYVRFPCRFHGTLVSNSAVWRLLDN